jgi:hypothetical protein
MGQVSGLRLTIMFVPVSSVLTVLAMVAWFGLTFALSAAIAAKPAIANETLTIPLDNPSFHLGRVPLRPLPRKDTKVAKAFVRPSLAVIVVRRWCILHAARTRLTNASTLDLSSVARDDTCAVNLAISSKALALRPAACSTDRISDDVLAVYFVAV